jgi:hypothetical protein
MFTISRRVVNFVVVTVLFVLGLVPATANTAFAAFPHLPASISSATPTVPGEAKIPTSIVWTLGPNGCGVKPLCSTFVGSVADASGRVIDSSLTSPPYPVSVTTVVKPGFSRVSATYAGNALYAPSSATREVRIPQPTVQIIGGTTEGDGPLQVRVSLTDPETGAPSGGYVTLSAATGQAETRLVAGSAVFLISGLKAGLQSVTVRAANPEYSSIYAFGSSNFEILPRAVTTTSAPITTKPSTTTTVPLRAVVLTLLPTAPLIASPSGPYQGPWGRYLNVRPQGEVGGGSWDSEGDFDVLCGGNTPPVIIDNGAADPLDRPVCVARGFGVQTVVVRDRSGRFATRNQQWIASKPIRLRAIAGQPVTFTLKGQPADVRPGFDFPRGTECVGITCTIPGNLVTVPAPGQRALFNWTDINQNPFRFGTVILDVVPPDTTTIAPSRIVTTISWTIVPVGCGRKFPCTGYEGRLADAAGKPISDPLAYSPAVKTVTTSIKPGFSRVSATYAGNATYAPSSDTREIRIPQAAIQIVSGTTEGNAPLVVRVSVTDPETGAVPSVVPATAVIATSTVQGGAGAGASAVFINGVATVSLNGLKVGDYIISIAVADLVGFSIFTNFTMPVKITPAGITTTTSAPTTTALATTSTPPTTTVPTTTTTPGGTRVATSIVWFVLNRCSPKAPCLTYVAGVADARGNLIANELSGGVQTVETSIKPGFLKFSATYAGNAVYAPSSGTRDVRIPQATIQIVAGTIEGSGPLDVLVSITDPETGQFTRAQVTVAVAEASPVGPGPELFASSDYIAREGLFKFPGLRVGTYIVSATVKDTVGSVLFSKFTVAARITAAGVTTTTLAPATTAPPSTTPPTTTPGNSTKTISRPANNSVSGVVVKFQINDATNVARIDWSVNGIPIGSDITPRDPWTWNAAGWGSGPFTLKAVVVDGSFKETTTRSVSFSIR